MAHRALVAVADQGGGYAVSRAPDGAADWLLEPLLCPAATVPPGFVDGPAVGRADTFEELLATHLDPLGDEALVVVDGDGRPTPYAVVPFVLATAGGLVGGDPPGAVVALVGRDADVLPPAYVRGWRHGTGEVLGEAVDAGLLAPAEAFAWLRDAVRRLGADGRRVAVLHPEG